MASSRGLRGESSKASSRGLRGGSSKVSSGGSSKNGRGGESGRKRPRAKFGFEVDGVLVLPQTPEVERFLSGEDEPDSEQ